MKFKLMLATMIAVAVSAPALADDKDKENTQAPQKERKICRNETVTGSLVSKRRICMTAAEWDQLAQKSKHSVDRYTSRSSGIPGEPTGPFAP
jgi:hypothetical protein